MSPETARGNWVVENHVAGHFVRTRERIIAFYLPGKPVKYTKGAKKFLATRDQQGLMKH